MVPSWNDEDMSIIAGIIVMTSPRDLTGFMVNV